MKILTSIIILTISLSGLLPGASPQAPRAVKGILDLRNQEITGKFLISLNGEWDFYWDQMLYPSYFSDTLNAKPDIHAVVPSYWTDYLVDGKKPDHFGFATYRLRIILPEGFNKRLGLSIPVFDSSYDLWLNGELVSSNGIPGKTAESSEPGYKPAFMPFSAKSDTITIIINVSNWDHRRGGFWLPLKFGLFNSVQRAAANVWAGGYVTISILAGFAIFFFIFFMLYPKDRIMAFFSLALIGIALRPFFTSQFLIYDFTTLNWIWTIRGEYLSLFIMILGWSWFIDTLYPSKPFRIYSLIISGVFITAAVVSLFTPATVFSYSILAYYPSILLIILYSLYKTFIGSLHRRGTDIIYFIAFVILTYGVVHDVLVSLGKSSSSGYLMSFIVILFVFMQAVMLLYKWVSSFYEKERLQVQLEFMNRNLEELINQRTLELKTRNEEIEKQNAKIAQQNMQLSETIHLKNRIFSVIAHDLRSPVVNILYMLNLLKEDEYKEKYDTFANSSIQYAQMVINLLENMLVWGRGQEEKIKFSPSLHDLSSLILTNMSILKESADRKDISVNFTQKGNSIAFFDKDLIDIVIRNLLSNAVKYTHRGGRISILVKDHAGSGEGVMVKICDNGIGIPPVKQKYIFTSTEMQSSPGTENEKGTGLGLKLCNELVKINRGSISLESREGEGTCFIIILPPDKDSEITI